MYFVRGFQFCALNSFGKFDQFKFGIRFRPKHESCKRHVEVFVRKIWQQTKYVFLGKNHFEVRVKTGQNRGVENICNFELKCKISTSYNQTTTPTANKQSITPISNPEHHKLQVIPKP